MSTQPPFEISGNDEESLRWLETSLVTQEADEALLAAESRRLRRVEFIAGFSETYPSYDHDQYAGTLTGVDGIATVHNDTYLTEVLDEILTFTHAISTGIPNDEQLTIMNGYKLELAADLRDSLGDHAFWLVKMIDHAYPTGLRIAELDQTELERRYTLHFGRTLAQVDAFKGCLDQALTELTLADRLLTEVTPTKEVAQEISRLAMSHGMLEGRALWENDRFGALPLDTLMRRGRLNQIKQEAIRAELVTLIGYHAQKYEELPDVFAQISSSVARVVITALEETMAS